MLEQLSRNWWVVLIRGVAGVLFGVGAFVWPGITLTVLVALFGAYALVDGALTIGAAIRHRRDRGWVLLLEGLLGVGAGLVAFFVPGLTAVALVYLIAAWAIGTGILEIAAAVRLRHVIHGEWLLGLAGLASIVFGVLLMLRPGVGALAVVWMIGAYAALFGALLVALALWLRGTGRGRLLL